MSRSTEITVEPESPASSMVQVPVSSVMFRNCVERQCHKGVKIESSKDQVDILLNSMSEWYRSVVT